MAAAFTMPSLGADMEAGTLVEWLKQPGETVSRGDIIAVVETDKGAIEVEIFDEGTITQLLVEPGTKVPVGTPLALIGDGAGAATKAPAGQPIKPEAVAPVPSAPPLPSRALATPSPLIRPAGRRISPAARRLAQQRGIDLATVVGSGPGQAVLRQDVEQAGKETGPAIAHDLSAMRRAIAAAMARSKREIPHYYLSHSFDISRAGAWLQTFNNAHPPRDRLLFSVLVAKAVALALRDFPELNGFWEAGRYVPSKAIHLGIAIAIRGGGLVAPAIHDTDRLSLPELMDKMNDLVARVRRGGFRSSEISDPTATVSSLGERGVEALLPIIYPPQVAIIGVGAPQSRPWAVDGEVKPCPVLTVTLAGDHRASDGHRGALFLRRIEALFDHPEAL